MLKNSVKQAGLTLIEVLVGLTIGIIIIAAIVSIFSNAITSTEQMLDSGKLNQALESAMNTMVSDVQRAGYWYKTDYSTNNTNPFLSGTDDLTTTSTCLTFSYDADTDGSMSDADRFGYRLSGGAIQYRSTGSTTCSAGSGWTNLTDPNLITITTFDVSVTHRHADYRWKFSK